MPSPVLNVDWLNENALRNYPIVDGASREAASGQVLPAGLICDISMPVPVGSIEPGNLFIQQVVGFSFGVAIALADKGAPGTTLASVTVFTASHQIFDSYTLVGQGTLLGSTGRITIGDPRTLLEASKVTYDFSAASDNSLLVIHATRPYIRGVTAFNVTDAASGVQQTITGIVGIEQGDNMVINVSGNSIVLNSTLVDPQEDDDDCGCADSAGAGGTEGTGDPILTVNGVEPDENGDMKVAGLDCTGISPITNGFEIVDLCSTPCCGCDQLDVLYQAVQAVETEIGRVQEVEEQLRGRIDNMQTVMANSQLNPPGGISEGSEAAGGTVWFLPIGPGGYGGVWVGG